MNQLKFEIYGDGEPLVMLHGWAMHSGIWRDFARQLAARFQVICIDLPGYGGSVWQGDWQLPQVAESILGVLPERRCHWLGWSMGANIALYIADHYPEQVKSLALVAGNPCFVAREDWPGMPEQVLKDFTENFDIYFLRTLQRFMVLQSQGSDSVQSKQVLKIMKQSYSEYELVNETALKAGLGLLKEGDFRAAVAAFNGPLFCLFGGRDRLIPSQLQSHIQAINCKAQTALIPNAGHLPFLTHEQETCLLLNEFFGND